MKIVVLSGSPKGKTALLCNPRYICKNIGNRMSEAIIAPYKKAMDK